MPRPPGMADPDKWTLDLPPGPDCSVGCSSNEFVSEDGSSLPGRENEDKFYTCNYQGKIQIYMVLDGHDGTRACEFAQKHLPSVLLSSELDGGVEMVGRAMRWAFLNTEREFFLGIDPHITRKITLQIEIQKARNSAEALSMFPDQVDEIQRLDNQIKGGTTAVLAIIYNGYLHIANVGDSRALLCYQGRDGHLHVEQLSVDHKTSNEDELRRLEDCGLNPNELRRHKRLGIQQNTRSIGDHSIKGGYKDIDVISHATKEPGTAEPFIAMPVDLQNISGFLVLMSDGLYDAYQLYTQRPAFVNQDLGYLIAQEMKQSNDIAAVAQNVVEKVKQLYRNTCKKNVYKGRLDDITLVIRNLNYPMGSLSHTASYPGSLHVSGVSYPPIHTAPILPSTRQNVFFPNPPYQHETSHGYATNVPPEYRDHSRVQHPLFTVDDPLYSRPKFYLCTPDSGYMSVTNSPVPLPPMSNHPSHYSPVSRSVMKSPVPLPRRDLKPIQPKDSSDEFDLYGWKVDDVTPMSSQPSSLAANSEGRTLTGPPHEEETIDKPDSDSEHNEDGDNIGVLTLPGDPLLSDFSETSDLEEEEKDVDPDGMIKSHVKFNTKFDMNLPWDELGGKETPLQGFLQGVEVIGVTEVTVPTQGVSFEWEGYGLRLCVPKGSLPVGVGDARVSIKASLSGQFLLPEDSDLLSPVFWISTPCKFIKPVTLKIQHCALREDETVLSDLSFVSAECSFPYRFRQINGGVFTTDSSYGSIQLSNFSGKGITGKKKTPRLYCAYLYHTMKQLYDWRYYFVVSQDLDAKNRVVREHYGHFAREEATLRIRFSRSEITLDIPVDGRMTKDGWRITPRSYPTISRKDADQYEPGQWIPECQLIVQWTREDQKPVQLMHKVDLIGAKAPYNFIQLTLNPVIEEIVRYPSISSSGSMDCSQGWQSTYQAGLDSEPELPDLMNEVAAKIPSKWRDIGLQLGVDQGALKEIAAISPGDTNLCYTNVFTRWKNQNSMTHPYTWSTIVHALQTRAVGEERLAYEIRNNLTGHPSQ